MPESEIPDDMPDRIVRVLSAADADDPVSAGRLQRLLADDGIDVATSAIRDVCDDLADEGRLTKALGPKYGLPD